VSDVGDPDFADDGMLIAALRAGDEGAFVWLLDRYSGPLHRLARSYVSTNASADEVVQETWLAVLNGIDRFEGRSSVKTWVYRILMNIARAKGVRDHRSVPFTSLRGELEADEPAVDPARFVSQPGNAPGPWAAPPLAWDEEPEARLTATETLTAVEHAIDMLPPNQRAVITLRDLEGWDAQEVCNALEISQTNQRVLLHRARAKVRQALETHFEEANR
jgi:RNA polymerase sigma-70 factor, ECF subfamily